MKKVMEFLDEHFYRSHDDCEYSFELKPDGHYRIRGVWEYPNGIVKSEGVRIKEHMKTDPSLYKWKSKYQMTLYINNETLNIRMFIINGESVSKYGYLQTYAHIPRTGPDQHGYYARSTDDEIIKYLNSYLVNFIPYSRKKKLEQLCINQEKN